MSKSELLPGYGTCFNCPAQRFRYSSYVDGDAGQAYPYCGIKKIHDKSNSEKTGEAVSLVSARDMLVTQDGIDIARIPKDCPIEIA